MTEDKSVNWVESHDNFANGEANIPQELSDEWIKYGWAGVTAQKNGMSLFFDRPYKDGGTYGTGGVGTYGNGSGPFTENSKLGDAAPTCGRIRKSWPSTTSATPWSAKRQTSPIAATTTA